FRHRRGADHVHRTGDRHVQDGRIDHRGGDGAGRAVGRGTSPGSAAQAVAAAMTDHPTITRSDVDAAARRIDGRVRRTPVLPADDGEFGSESPSEHSRPGFTWFKLEQLQHTGSSKARGAFNRVLAAAEGGRLTDAGVVAASGGNAGLAVAHAAATQGVPARVYVPETAPAVKLAKLAELGATVVTRSE